MDRSVHDDDGKQIDASDALLVCDKSVKSNDKHHGLKTWVGDAALLNKATPTQLCISGNTGCCAARWALALGCRPVYLVGMDAAYRDGQTDFWGANRHHHGGSTLNIMRKELTRLHLDFPRDVLVIPTGQLLREIAGELPDVDQAAHRRAVLAELSSALADCPAPRDPAGD